MHPLWRVSASVCAWPTVSLLACGLFYASLCLALSISLFPSLFLPLTCVCQKISIVENFLQLVLTNVYGAQRGRQEKRCIPDQLGHVYRQHRLWRLGNGRVHRAYVSTCVLQCQLKF